MSTFPHHQDALFSLNALNDLAMAVVAHPFNHHLVSRLPEGGPVLDVGFNIRSKSRNTLATLGRSETDIILEGDSIAKVQCSFEVDLDSGIVMLYDRSNGLTTQVFGDHATPFQHGRCRRVVVQMGLNTMIGIGGIRCDLVQFELIWHLNPSETIEKIKSLGRKSCDQHENPRFARTVDEALSVLPSIEFCIPEEGKPRIRYEIVGSPLGSGQFGTVYKCFNVDSGKFMAVKKLTCPPGKSQEDWRESLQHTLEWNVQTLSAIGHVS